jgi:hypothetical protein
MIERGRYSRLMGCEVMVGSEAMVSHGRSRGVRDHETRPRQGQSAPSRGSAR